jgi:P-type E1-E2 ATPase
VRPGAGDADGGLDRAGQGRRRQGAVPQRLRELGLDVAVLTGDHPTRGAALQQELGVPVAAGLLPEDKVAAVTQARHSLGAVAMVGDGINDAPALAVADAGVALGCGADLARDAAPVCLLGDDLSRLPWAIELARRTVRVIRQNLLWAFAYNGLGVGLACAGLLNPVLAALAMVGSSLLVVGNSLRLGSFSERREQPAVREAEVAVS